MEWHPAAKIAWQIPPRFAPWLLDLNSMTQAMRRITSDIRVDIIHQSWQRPTASEAKYLVIEPLSSVLIREVYLLADETVWMYARTVIPAAAFKGQEHDLLQALNHRPLGDILYQQPGIYRQQLEITRLCAFQPEFQHVIAKYPCQATILWGRRAQFRVFDSRLSVSEILFPEIAEYVA